MNIERELRRGHRAGRVDVEDLRRHAIFRNLPNEALNSLASLGSWHRYDRHQEFADLDSRERAVWIIDAGLARRYLLSDGRQFTRALHRPGVMLDLADLLPPLSEVTRVEAMIDETVVISVLRSALRETILSPAGADLLESASAQAKEAERLLVELVAFDGQARLAHRLAELALETDDRVVRYTRDELGAMVNLSRQHVQAFLADFLRLVSVHYEPHHIAEVYILEVERLAQWGAGKGEE